MSWKVNFFQTSRGNSPVSKFIEEQDSATIAKITHSIELLVSYGPFLKPPHIKKLRDSLYELRIPGKVTIRIFYTVFEREFYLIHAFKKQSQKTPTKELKIALDRIREII